MSNVKQCESAILSPSIQRGTCRCGNEARPGQRDCYPCHAAAQVSYRARQAMKMEAMRRRISELSLVLIAMGGLPNAGEQK